MEIPYIFSKQISFKVNLNSGQGSLLQKIYNSFSFIFPLCWVGSLYKHFKPKYLLILFNIEQMIHTNKQINKKCRERNCCTQIEYRIYLMHPYASLVLMKNLYYMSSKFCPIITTFEESFKTFNLKF